jgi:hypothetical protein
MYTSRLAWSRQALPQTPASRYIEENTSCCELLLSTSLPPPTFAFHRVCFLPSNLSAAAALKFVGVQDRRVKANDKEPYSRGGDTLLKKCGTV